MRKCRPDLGNTTLCTSSLDTNHGFLGCGAKSIENNYTIRFAQTLQTESFPSERNSFGHVYIFIVFL